MKQRPVVIIGAPRSGTNMLRNALTCLPGVDTWPCDEINYVWRHGNVYYDSDEFTSDMARPEVARYVRRQFEWVGKRYKANYIVEKTCANSLRMDFVNRIVPEARYIVIRRNGIDAAASAMEKWNAKASFSYRARKAYFVPVMDLPAYVYIYGGTLLRRVLSGGKIPSRWGPVISDMDLVMSKYSLPEVCILQWKRCVELADEALTRFDGDRILEVAYETFVGSPAAEMARIADFLNLTADVSTLNQAVSEVTTESVGKGARSLEKDQLDRMRDHASDTLKRHGYA